MKHIVPDPFKITWNQPAANKDMSLKTKFTLKTWNSEGEINREFAGMDNEFTLTRAAVRNIMP